MNSRTLGVLLFAVSAHAQPCEPGWLGGQGVPGLDRPASAAIAWDPDGTGPVPERLVVGGEFGVAGDTTAERVAAWDGVRWSAMGSGLGGISCFAAGSNGALFASGRLASQGWAFGIAEWRNGAWAPVTAQMDQPALAMLVLPNGDLLAGGAFSTIDNESIRGLARWDGVSWKTGNLNPLSANARVAALAHYHSGGFIVGGNFATPIITNIGRWDGNTWDDLQGGLAEPVTSVAVRGGEIIALAGTIRRWTGQWTSLQPPYVGTASLVAALPNRNIVAAGPFAVGGSSQSRVVVWNGTAWSTLGGAFSYSNFQYPPNVVRALVPMADNSFAAVGEFFAADGVPALHAAIWKDQQWTSAGRGDGLSRAALDWASLPDGRLVAGGEFGLGGGVECNHIAMWNGSRWAPLGTGVSQPAQPSFLPFVSAVATSPAGHVFAAGNFLRAGGVPVNRIARWDGLNWHALGSGITGSVHALEYHPTAGLVAAGQFAAAGGIAANSIARWDGVQWKPMESGLQSGSAVGYVAGLKVLRNGDLVATGSFDRAGGVVARGVARWTPAGWSALGEGLDGVVYCIEELDNGDLVAGGSFMRSGPTTVNNVALWNGHAWLPLGEGLGALGGYEAVRALHAMPGGEIAAAGSFVQSGLVRLRFLARWNGSRWVDFGDGPAVSGTAVSLHRHNGVLMVGGYFSTAGGVASTGWARWGLPPCYADCDGSGSLSANDLLCFFQRFAVADPVANCDCSTGQPILTANDFACFVTHWTAGCS